MDNETETSITTQDKIVTGIVIAAVAYSGYKLGRLCEDWVRAGVQHYKDKKNQNED